MNILIIEAYTDGNIGSAALVENSIRLLRHNFPDSKIKILAQFPEHIASFSGFPSQAELITLPFNQSRFKQLAWLLKTVIWMLVNICALYLRRNKLAVPFAAYTFNQQKQQALQSFVWADMVVSIGAERINDNFYKAMFFSLYILWCAKLCRKYLVLFPCTIGPFHFALTKFLSKWILNQCDVIYLRDKRSYLTVRRLGVSKPRVLATCDVAVLQETLAPELLSKRLEPMNLPVFRKVPSVGISVMRWSYIAARGGSRYRDYKLAVARAADGLIEKAGVEVIFLATNVFVHGCREDDVQTIKEIMALVKHKSHVHALDILLTPAEIKSLIALLDFCVMTRMHATIFSTGICTPTVTINYQFKLKEYMRLMGLGRFTLDIDQVDSKKLQALVWQGWQERQQIRTQLQEKMKFWKKDLTFKIGLLKSFFDNRQSYAGSHSKSPQEYEGTIS